MVHHNGPELSAVESLKKQPKTGSKLDPTGEEEEKRVGGKIL